ncbi:MAG: hydrogenase formation protein HypD [Clostridiales bacterium]|nr:hydrogenase formation protein HypD [Clostridiales bacterium]
MNEYVKKASAFLRDYDGPKLSFMEICGSHTNALSKSGIRGMLSEKIRLIPGPGCPVCVTPTSFIDRLIRLLEGGEAVVTFGDLLRVPGSKGSLNDLKALGYDVRMVYSPADIVDMAMNEPDKSFVFAAVGFETTTPVYTLLLEELIACNVKNVRLLTALKTMPEVTEMICEGPTRPDGFLAPGHVCTVTGSDLFRPVAEKYGIPFAVGGFKPEELVMALYALVKKAGSGEVINCYRQAVTESGNKAAEAIVNKYFIKSDAYWRGIGMVKSSGLLLRKEYMSYDAGSDNLTEDNLNTGCCCGRVITGEITPDKCPLFGKACTPANPVGACMVSEEGSCRAYL